MLNSALVHLPCLLSIAILATLLILRERQRDRTEKYLLDRLLTKEGFEPLPENHPIAEVIESATSDRPITVDDIRKASRQRAERARKTLGGSFTFHAPGYDLPAGKAK